MDNIKIFAKRKNEIESLKTIYWILSQNMRMEFEIEKGCLNVWQSNRADQK